MLYCPFFRTAELGMSECIPGCALRMGGKCAIAVIADNISSYVRHCISCGEPLGPMDLGAFCSDRCRRDYILADKEEESRVKLEECGPEESIEPEPRNEEEVPEEGA